MIYIISIICLITSFILIKKTDKKLDILSFIGITLLLTMCYNVFVAYVFTYFKIPITLLNLSITNFIIAVLIATVIINKKEIQKYEINKIDIVFISIIAIGVGIISYLEFGFPFEIKYETSDPSLHYLTAKEFAKSDSLLIKNKDKVYNSFRTRKPASYVNSGLIMKCFLNHIDEFEFYNIFIAFGIFVLLLTGTVMYNTLVKFSKNNKTRFMACIVSLIYVLGYPLNSFLFGFEYLSLSILIINVIIEMAYYFEKDYFENKYNIIIFFLLNFGLFFSYYTFIPFMYSALWIYFCIHSYNKNKKLKDIFNKKNIIMLALTLLLPFVLGYIYHMAPNIYSMESSEIVTSKAKYLSGRGFSQTGYSYINFYSNFMLFIPLTIYVIKKEYKNKHFDLIFLIFIIVYLLLLFTGYCFNKVSAYYLSKSYYILWGLLIYENFKGLMYIYERDKHDTYVFIIAYIILIIMGLTLTKVDRIEANSNVGENIFKVTDIYGSNKTILTETWTIYKKEELEILKYVRDNLDYNKKIEFLGNRHQILWGYSILKYINYTDGLDDITGNNIGQQRLLSKLRDLEINLENADYLVYFNRSIFYEYYSKKLDLMKNGEIIYQNDLGGVIKYTK